MAIEDMDKVNIEMTKANIELVNVKVDIAKEELRKYKLENEILEQKKLVK